MNAAVAAISLGSPSRWTGMPAAIFSRISGFMLATISVLMKPGAIAFTRMR